jgi:hypothetical protein
MLPVEAQAEVATQCSKATAGALLAGQSKPDKKLVQSVLCGRFGGPRQTTTMIAVLGPSRCRLVEGWIAFRLEAGAWRKIWKRRGAVARSISRAGNQVKETVPIQRDWQNCRFSGKKWRLWHWNGKRFVPGGWLPGGGNKSKNRRRLVLSPEIARISAAGSAQFSVHLFEGTRDLGDVSKEIYLDAQKQHYTKCRAEVQIFVTPYCSRLGSCDQATLICTAISPGEWLLRAYGKFGRFNLTSNYGGLLVSPKETLTITPDHLEPVIYGLDAEQQLTAVGAEGPVTWEAEIRHESESSGYYAESLTSVRHVGAALDLEHLDEDVKARKRERYFVLDPSTGLLTGSKGLTLPPWNAQVTIRAWDTAGNSREKQFEVSSITPPFCASVCLRTGANLSAGVAWNNQPGCGLYTYRLYRNGVPGPNSWTARPLTYDLPGGRQHWMPDQTLYGLPSEPQKEPVPGEALAVEIECWVLEEKGYYEKVSSVSSNTVVLHD